MDRLTKHVSGRILLDCKIKSDCGLCVHNKEDCCPTQIENIHRLAAYEDTGLTAEEVAIIAKSYPRILDVATDYALYRSILHSPDGKEILSIKELRELVQAKKENRIILMKKCPICGLVNAPHYRKDCDRCGAMLDMKYEGVK